jgi:very-short-patch-repair endonuclease
LIVEADGSQHDESMRDERRDAFLARQGRAVLRFWNHDILANRERIIGMILARADPPW